MSHPVALNEFDFNGNAVRTMTDEDSEVWFVAKDVADILGYAETSNMTERLDEDEKRKQTLQNGRNYTNQTLRNESGLYNAVMGSQKVEAKHFKKWVTSEVLPSIRKTGGYNMVPQTYADALRQLADQAEAAERAYGNHVMQHNKYVHSKGEGFRHATIAHVKSVIPGKYSWQMLANYCSYHSLSVEILTPHYQSVPLNSYPAEAWMAIYNIDITKF